MLIDEIIVERDDGLGARNPRLAIDGGAWALAYEGLEGYDGLEHDVSVQELAQYSGGLVAGNRVPSVDRVLTAIGFGDPMDRREEAERFFSSDAEFLVHVRSGGRRRVSRARQYSFRLKTDNATDHQLLEWGSIHPDPFWLSEESTEFDIAAASPMRGFPFMSLGAPYVPPVMADSSEALEPGPQSDGICAGHLAGVLRHEIEMVNNGGGTAYPRFVMTASAGVSNPRVSIIDASGASVCKFGVKVEMADGDELVVDFSSRPTLITYNGENYSNRVTSGSTLATGIPHGTFTVTWECDSGDAALSIRPSIQERYESI